MSPALEGQKTIIVFAIIGIVIAMAIVLYNRHCCTVATTEGFESSAPALTSCPQGSKSFYDKNSNLMCCSGELNGKFCEGTVVCSFSNNSDKYPSCRVLLQEQAQKAAANSQQASQKKSDEEECPARCRQLPPLPEPAQKNPTGYVMAGTDIKGEIPIQIIFKTDAPGGYQMSYLTQNNDRFIYKAVTADGKEGEQYSIKGTLSGNTITDFASFLSFFQKQDRNTIMGGIYKIRKVN